MSVTQEDIDKVAKLARIEISQDNQGEDKKQLAQQIDGIIGWIDKLDEANVDGVDPLTNVHDSILRVAKDEVSDGDKAEEVLKNAKNNKYGYFTVPKVIE